MKIFALCKQIVELPLQPGLGPKNIVKKLNSVFVFPIKGMFDMLFKTRVGAFKAIYFMFELVFFDVPRHLSRINTLNKQLDTTSAKISRNGGSKSLKLMYSCRKPPQT